MAIQQQEIPVYTHDPDSRKDYTVDWGDFLKPQLENEAADALIDARWTVPEGVTIEDARFDDRYSTVWVTVAGVAGAARLYDLTVHVVTREGREEDQTIRLRIRQK